MKLRTKFIVPQRAAVGITVEPVDGGVGTCGLHSLLKNPASVPAPKGASEFEEVTASLKRCPDTNLNSMGLLHN
jgi:hypothetical protein